MPGRGTSTSAMTPLSKWLASVAHFHMYAIPLVSDTSFMFYRRDMYRLGCHTRISTLPVREDAQALGIPGVPGAGTTVGTAVGCCAVFHVAVVGYGVVATVGEVVANGDGPGTESRHP